MSFKRAVKHEAKGRVAIVGPSGSGKSYTALVLARTLAGPDGKIACIDTEHGSLSKYADLFDFDCDEPTVYSVEYWLAKLSEAERDGYAVFCTDSLSHFWMGPGGALEFVDDKMKSSGRGDSFAGWKAFRPHERMMIDRMLASPCHIICTMRTQTEYVEEVNDKGKKVRKKIGLKPVQREGLEYEFDLVGALDEDNTLIIDKSRVILSDGKMPYSGKAIAKPSSKDFEPFREWLKGKPAEPKVDHVAIWTKRITEDPNLAVINGWLPEIRQLPETPRKVVWGMVKAHVTAFGCTYDDASKQFVAPPPQANGTLQESLEEQGATI